MNENLHAIVLAAGKGTRMKTELPKCAYPFCGKPMVNYIIENCLKAGINDIIAVVGYKSEVLIECLPKYVKHVIQEEQLGTGHATKCTEELLKDKDGLTIIFPGDMPLIDAKTINGLIEQHIKDNNVLTVVTTILDNPKSYGRIYRENGKIKRIIEFKDCTEEDKKINEINVGLYCVDNKKLFESLNKVKNNNKANEYYLTDIVEILGNEFNVDSYIVENTYKLTGINDLETLQNTEKCYLHNQANK